MKILKWLDDDNVTDLPKYVVAFDILNIISCIAVVALHANLAFWEFSYERYWVTSNLIASLFCFAVPVFLMISGATLMDYRKRYCTREFFKKRVVKTFVPFIVWSVIAIVYRLICQGMSFFDGGFSLSKLISVIFNAGANVNYWFFIMLFAVYLSIPVLSAVENQKRKKIFTYTAVLAVVTNSILPLACRLFNIQMNNDIKLPVAAGYIMFAIIGYCITRYPVNRVTRVIVYVFGGIGFLVHFFGTWFMSHKSGAVNNMFSEYLSIPCVMFSVAVFMWVFYNRHLPKNEKVLRLIKKISGASFGVYLMHWFFIDASLQLFAPDIKTWWWRVLGTIVIYTVCVLVTMVIKKIPIIKNIVP